MNEDKNIVEEPEMVLENDEPITPKKKKKGLKIAILVIVGVLVIGGGVLLTLYLTQKEVFLNKWAMLVKNDNEYFHYVVDRNMNNSKAVNTSHEESEKEWKAPESFETKGKFGLFISPEFAAVINKDFAGINNFAVNYDFVSDKGKILGGIITPSYKGVDIISIGGVYQPDTKKAYVSIPSYKPQVIDLSALINKEQKNADQQENGKIKINEIIDEEKISGLLSNLQNQESESLADKFLDFIQKKVNEAELQKNVKITVNGLEKELNVLNIKISHDQCVEFINDGLDDLGKILEPFLSLTGGKNEGIDLSKISTIIDSLKKSLENIFKEIKISIETKLYVDEKGNISGGLVKLLVDGINIPVGTTKLKMDGIGLQINILKDVDESDPEKSKVAGEISIIFQKMPIGLLNFIHESENKDGNRKFDLKVNISDKLSSLVASLPGSIKDMVSGVVGNILDEIPKYSLEISGENGDIHAEKHNTKFDFAIKKEGADCVKIEFKNEFAAGTPEIPLDLSEGNVIDIYKLPDSDYIDIGLLFNQILGKLDEINDDKLNNFMNEIVAKLLKSATGELIKELPPMVAGLLEPITSKLDAGQGLDALKDLLNTPGISQVADSLIKDELKKALEMIEPYDHGKLTELPKMDDGRYVYSWDTLKDNDISYVNVDFRVFDHFPEPQTYSVDLEKEKENYLKQYAGQVYYCEAMPGEYIQMGDRITFDAVPLLLGIPVDGYAFYNNPATVGEYEYGKGTDDKLLGMGIGQEKTVTITVPKDEMYGSFGGMDIDFRVTVRSITKSFGPEWSERFIVGKLGFASLDACEEYLKTEAEKKLPEDIHEPDTEEIKTALLEDLVLKISTDNYSIRVRDEVLNYLKESFKQAGYDTSIINPSKRKGTNAYDFYFSKYALVSEIAYKEGLSLSEDDLRQGYERLAKELGYPDADTFVSVNEPKYGKRILVDTVIERLAADIIYEKANISWVE